MKYEVVFIEYSNLDENKMEGFLFNIKRYSRMKSAVQFIYDKVIRTIAGLRDKGMFSMLDDMYESNEGNGKNYYYVMRFNDGSAYKWVITEVSE